MKARHEVIPALRAFSDQELTQRWLATQPREAAVTLAVMQVLRMLPHTLFECPEDVTLRIFRAVFVAWALARHSVWDLHFGFAARLRFPRRPIDDGDDFYDVADTVDAILAAADPTLRQAAAKALSFVQIADAALADVMDIDKGLTFGDRASRAIRMAGKALWPAEPSDWVRNDWATVKAVRLSEDQGWEVWTDWYEGRLLGRPPLGREFDSAVATLPDQLWKQGPKAVNAAIRRLIEAHTPPEPIPAQGAGPHFALSPAHKIGLATPSEIDAAGNNLGRLRQQLPLVREAAGDLAGHLNPNAFPELARNLTAYRATIEGEPETIAWGVVFGRGVRLDNAAAAARRQIEDRL
jgi:hypothetical protein